MEDSPRPAIVLVLESPTGKPGSVTAALEGCPEFQIVRCLGIDDLGLQAHRYGSAAVVIDASVVDSETEEAIEIMAKKYRAGRFPALLILVGEENRGKLAEAYLAAGATAILPSGLPPVFLRNHLRSVLRAKEFHDDLAEALQEVARERNAANSALQSLLPEAIPTVPGWEIARHFSTARTRAGDIHDLFLLSDGRLGLLVADALGHGLENLAPMATLRGIVRCRLEAGDAPGDLLADINRTLCGLYGSEVVLSAAVLVGDPATGDFCQAIAGGCQPLVAPGPASGPRWEDSAAGPPLGVDEDARFPESRVHLNPGGWLIIATNGAYQLHNAAGDLLGTEGFEILASSVAGAKSAQELLGQLVGAIRAYDKEKGARDDNTMVLVKRAP